MKNQKDIKNATKCALKFLEKYSSEESMTCAYKAFKALAELTLKDLDTDASVEECRYYPFDIAQQMGENYVKETKEKTTNNAKGYLKKLMEAVTGHNDTFKTIANKSNFPVIPVVKYIEGGGKGNPNLYYIDYEEIIFSENIEKQENIDNDNSQKNNISYFVEHIKLPRINNWIYNYEFSGFRFGIEIITFILIFIITAIFGIYIINIIFYGKFSISDFPIIGMYFFTALFFKRRWDCLRKRIILSNHH